MPSYVNNPYSYFYPQPYNPYLQQGYQSALNYNMPQQQNYSTQAQVRVMEWVEGEIGAKAFQMPQGWPANQPVPLWDSTDTVIWLKSWNPMGIPNPMQKLKYTMPEQTVTLPVSNDAAVSTQSGVSENSNYVTKNDFDALKKELKEMISTSTANVSHASGTQSNNNRGGNR